MRLAIAVANKKITPRKTNNTNIQKNEIKYTASKKKTVCNMLNPHLADLMD